MNKSAPLFEDKEVIIINCRYPEDFERDVNSYLSQGGWRVAETQMSVTDHEYVAMLIKAAAKGDSGE